MEELRENEREASPDTKFCPHCGNQLPAQKLTYCPFCGKRIYQDQTTEHRLKIMRIFTVLLTVLPFVANLILLFLPFVKITIDFLGEKTFTVCSGTDAIRAFLIRTTEYDSLGLLDDYAAKIRAAGAFYFLMCTLLLVQFVLMLLHIGRCDRKARKTVLVVSLLETVLTLILGVIVFLIQQDFVKQQGGFELGKMSSAVYWIFALNAAGVIGAAVLKTRREPEGGAARAGLWAKFGLTEERIRRAFARHKKLVAALLTFVPFTLFFILFLLFPMISTNITSAQKIYTANSVLQLYFYQIKSILEIRNGKAILFIVILIALLAGLLALLVKNIIVNFKRYIRTDGRVFLVIFRRFAWGSVSISSLSIIYYLLPYTNEGLAFPTGAFWLLGFGIVSGFIIWTLFSYLPADITVLLPKREKKHRFKK